MTPTPVLALARLLTGAWLADTAARSFLLHRFFSRPLPPAPPTPSVSLIQPLTVGINDPATRLRDRLALSTPRLRHIWVTDAADTAMQRVCEQASAGRSDVVLVRIPGGIASKMEKMRAALPHAEGDVLWFLDDDVTPDEQTFAIGLAHLYQQNVGAVFGLARYTNWSTPWASLMSAFVNANALPNYVMLAALTEPYTITGHCFAIRRAVFTQIGGLEGLDGRIDDDHELARRVRAHGLQVVQTPFLYRVDNALPTARAYLRQMQRWFVFPRELMLPMLTQRERLLTAAGSASLPLPLLVLLLAIRWPALRWLVVLLALVHVLHYRWMESRFVGARTPATRLPLVALRLFSDPLVLLWALLGRGPVEWRGQRLLLRGVQVTHVQDEGAHR